MILEIVMALLLLVSIENECRRIREFIMFMLYIREVLDSISKSMFVYDNDRGEYLCKICEGKGHRLKDYWNEKSGETMQHCDSEMLEQGRVLECSGTL